MGSTSRDRIAVAAQLRDLLWILCPPQPTSLFIILSPLAFRKLHHLFIILSLAFELALVLLPHSIPVRVVIGR